ncbi:MAG: hypothetical protein IJ340_06245 [Odoribacter sp.]|nr:hypothetical protein [Odoribacter sp.]
MAVIYIFTLINGRWQEPGQHADYKMLGDYWDLENEVWVNEKTRATSRFVQKRNELDFASLTAYLILCYGF